MAVLCVSAVHEKSQKVYKEQEVLRGKEGLRERDKERGVWEEINKAVCHFKAQFARINKYLGFN